MYVMPSDKVMGEEIMLEERWSFYPFPTHLTPSLTRVPIQTPKAVFTLILTYKQLPLG